MRSFQLLSLATVCLLATAGLLMADVPHTVDFQGRLTTASDAPVPDGLYSARFSLYTTSVGGAPVWTEMTDIQCAGGLFSARLGGGVGQLGDVYEQHADQALWLETQVTIGGVPQTMTPRTLLSSVPYAFGARRVVDDTIATGSLAILAGVAIPKFISMTYNNAKTALEVMDGPRVNISLGTDWTSSGSALNLKQYDPSQSYVVGDAAVYSSATGSGNNINWMFEGGGVVQSSSQISSSPTGVAHTMTWNSLANPGGPPNHQWNVHLNPTGSPAEGVHSDMAMDFDGDGILDMHRWEKVDNSEMVSGMEVDTDDNGVVDGSMHNTVSSELLRRRLVLVSGSVGSSSSITDSVGPESAMNVLAIQNGNIPTAMIESRVSGSSSSLHVSRPVSDPLGQIDLRESASLFAQPDTAGMSVKNKGGGFTTDGWEMLSLHDGNDLSGSSNSSDSSEGSSYNLRTRVNQLEQILRNHGLLTTARVSSSCNQDSAGHEIAIAENSTGAGSSVRTNVQPLGGAILIHNEGYGAPREMSLSASSTSTSLSLDDDITLSSDGDKSTISVVPPSAGSYEFELVVTDNSGLSSSATMLMKNGARDTTIIIDGDGRIGINEPLPDAPIHHGSGARLTAAGDWTNASDRDLKENFTAVDGEEILERIGELPISQWNYKNDSDEVTHIGPTAQDFKEVFGVGSNDKTISTIDPSGIALAAIKQLSKENNELKSQVAELKSMVEELAKKK